MTISQDKSCYVCPYCGTKELINYEIPDEKLEGIVYDAVKDAFEDSGMSTDRTAGPSPDIRTSSLSSKAKSVLAITACSILSFITFIISMACFSMGDYPLTGSMFLIVTLIFLYLVIAKSISYSRMKSGKSYIPFMPVFTRIMVVAVVSLNIFAFACISIDNEITYSGSRNSGTDASEQDPDNPDWPTRGTALKLPIPKIGTYTYYSGSTFFSLEIKKITKRQANEYVDEIIALGFDMYVEELDTSYKAYDEEDYYLQTFYNDSDSSLSVYVYEPKEYITLVWPSTGILTKLPVPDKLEGIIDSSSSNFADVTIKDCTYEDMANYLSKCVEYGFKEVYSSSNSATYENDEGYKLYVDLNTHGDLHISVSYYSSK